VIIIAATLDYADQESRDAAVSESAATQQATRDEEPGCHVYCFAADPCVPTRIQVYELWEDEASVAAHFLHPNYLAMRDILRTHNPTAAWNRMYLVARDEPVYGEGGTVRSKFFVDDDAQAG
jgi:quinol monooxygenase YgiN